MSIGTRLGGTPRAHLLALLDETFPEVFTTPRKIFERKANDLLYALLRADGCVSEQNEADHSYGIRSSDFAGSSMRRTGLTHSADAGA